MVSSGRRRRESDRIRRKQPDDRDRRHRARDRLGTLAAYGLWKRSSAWLSGSLYLSLVTPEIVTGVSLLALFQWIFRYVNLRLGMHTVILAHVGFSLAYVVVVVLARLRSFDRTLEEAALDLGATEFGAFWRVTLPYLVPAIAAAAMLAFTVSIDDYVITSLVAGVDSQTLPMVIYAMARRGVNPVLNAVSTLVVFGLGMLIMLSERLRQNVKRTHVSARRCCYGRRPAAAGLG